ncbi:MAG: class I SAM-dependent methyltransferase [Chitinophagaceae bacterium]
MIKNIIKRYINKLPYIKALIKQANLYDLSNPPGHYYSPIISVEEIKKQENEIFAIKSNKIAGIDLNENEQVRLLNEFAKTYQSIPFTEERQITLRYYYNNDWYRYSDAIFLHLVIRYFKPKSIIEVGSGFSSAVMLDTNDLFFDGAINTTFIEPYPERLLSIFTEADNEKHKIIRINLQDVNLEVFDNLEENDILFIDSTHVTKTNSDVNKIFFEILPRLKKGVLIHFHDIFYPFEYPKKWVLEWKGFGWNEDYILRAFLMHNTEYRIVLFNTFLEHFHLEWFREHMPLCLKDEGGSIWLQKL